MTPGRPISERLREAHGQRLRAWLIDAGDAHEDLVVARAVAAYKGTEPEPISHGHSHEETGMCVECDAAAILLTIRDEDDNVPDDGFLFGEAWE